MLGGKLAEGIGGAEGRLEEASDGRTGEDGSVACAGLGWVVSRRQGRPGVGVVKAQAE